MTFQKAWTRGAIYFVLIAFAAWYLMPIYLMLITGMKTFDQVNIATMWALPRGISIDGFSQAWVKVAPNFKNSIMITVPAAIISAFIGSINGYIFAKWKFRGSNTLFMLFLVGMFLPYQGILIPLVQTLMALGLYGSIVGVIFVHCIFGIPITALMFRSYFAGIPNELVDAAKIDGCGFFGIYRWVLLPIAFPAFAVVLIWQFTTIWNDYLIGLVVVSNPRLAPVNVAVQNLAGTYYTQWQVQMSGALIAALPTIIVYLALGKFFMRGLLAGSLKG
ncbi:MAG: carbohydrate ABC transporter permease [Anaerolineae bacterium]